MLAGDHTLPIVVVLRLAREARKGRWSGLFRLHHQGLLFDPGLKEQYPGPRADAADPDDLVPNVSDREVIKKVLPI